MYEYVNENEVKEYRSYCSDILTKLRDSLYEKEINIQFVLIGSGGRNMVMRNGEDPFDLDYNINIIYMPEEYWDNPKKLKDLIRGRLNSIVHGSRFSDGKDSRSVITALLKVYNNKVEFKVDISICSKTRNGNWQRLIHDKHSDPERFIWNVVPNSKDIKNKEKYIKHNKCWSDVRKEYRNIKNDYLKKHDYNHPSFVCYIEAVNHVYQKLRGK